MQYATRTQNAVELAAFFNDPRSDLSANGLTMDADGDLLTFAGTVLEFLREHRTRDDDGYISYDDETGWMLWVGGDGFPLWTAAR
jgi:hypothetical protein